MPRIILLVGPPGSGKSTKAQQLTLEGYTYVNQDSQGKDGHLNLFNTALGANQDIVVDRMNFNCQQRNRYLLPKKEGYLYEIQVFHESYETCLRRCMERKNHQTIKNEVDAKSALDFFFKNYERVQDHEADIVTRFWPEVSVNAIVCDLDGTLCNIEHRQHHVRQDEHRKKNWPMFFAGIKDDKLNQWCSDILDTQFISGNAIVLCSGRGTEYRPQTHKWLIDNGVRYDNLFMRQAGDSRKDSVVKEILLDFEILTRYTPYFIIDDRKQVVEMWRKRGFVCLQCDEGDF